MQYSMNTEIMQGCLKRGDVALLEKLCLRGQKIWPTFGWLSNLLSLFHLTRF